MHEQLLDGDRAEARIDRQAEPSERIREHRTERRGERQPALVDEARDAHGGDRLREAGDPRQARQRSYRHSPAWRRSACPSSPRRLCGCDLVFAHPVPEKGIEPGVRAAQDGPAHARLEGMPWGTPWARAWGIERARNQQQPGKASAGAHAAPPRPATHQEPDRELRRHVDPFSPGFCLARAVSGSPARSSGVWYSANIAL